ncbi:MAG: tetratricopeptide repeat protein [Deltaproteobacteria bacterium]|nr:tetratricopeptide repeat protein [Deltaproteobacteria bacterium]
MSDCLSDEVVALMLDGRLSDAARADAERHLTHCASCRGLIAGAARVTEDDVSQNDAAAGADPSLPLPRGAIVGRYVCLNPIAAGGMGVLYAAYDPELDRKVAVKLLRTDFNRSDTAPLMTRMLREAKAMARLSHPNVVAVHDVGTVRDEVFIAMEFVAGSTLSDWLSAKPRPWREILDAFIDAGRGLAAAHEVGIVHRDFKPDNVLVGYDGRVRVTDFGLAHSLDANASRVETTVVSGAPSTLATDVSGTGLLIGTPKFMAPEQMEQGSVDARTDVFSFCVSLFEALYGEPPYGGESLEAIQSAIRMGQIREGAPGRAVPTWLRRALVRGLSADPARRFSSMTALLDAFDWQGRMERRRIGIGVGALALAISGLIAFWPKMSETKICQGAAEKIESVWGAKRAEAARHAFVATALPFAEDFWRRTESALDAYTKAWADMRTEACVATRVRREQSESLLDLRIACLDARLRDFDALVEIFSRADAKVVEKSIEVARSIADLRVCADTETLKRGRPILLPGLRAKIDAFDTTMAPIRALLKLGKFREALPRATAAIPEATALRHAPTLAKAYQLLGEAHYAGDAAKEAVRAFQEALWAAESAGDERQKISAAIFLVYVTGYGQRNPDRAEEWARFASAVLARIGRNDEVEAWLVGARAAVHDLRGRYAELLRDRERAVALFERAVSRNDLRTAEAIDALGYALRRAGRSAEAARHHEEAAGIYERLLHPDHPAVGRALYNLGFALAKNGYARQALASFERALEISRKIQGSDRGEGAWRIAGTAHARTLLGEFEKAEALSTRALALAEESYGRDHARVAWFHMVHAAALRERGAFARALGHLDHALRMQEPVFGRDHPGIAWTLTEIAILHREMGDPRKALVTLERALAIAEKRVGAESLTAADVLAEMSATHVSMRRLDEAEANAQRAITIRARLLDADHPDLSRAFVHLARARLAKGDRRGALTHLSRALASEEKRLGRSHPVAVATRNEIQRVEVALRGAGAR